MVYGCSFNLFFKSNTELSNEEKLNKLKSYNTGEVLTLLRNIEEEPRKYEEEIIKGVYSVLYERNIMCI